MKNKKINFSKIVILSSVLIISFCARKTEHLPKDKILAQIGDKIITASDFKRRAEYTIRPQYCNRDNYIHRKIVLNSLIAEKLLALETGEDNELTSTEQFQDYLKGRREQSMRQWLFYKDYYDKVVLDTSEIRKKYKLAGREYNIEYVSLKDSAIAQEIQNQLNNGSGFDEVFSGLEDIPQRKVKWESPEHKTVHNALYSEELQKGQVIGPLRIEKDYYMIMRIAGWSDFRFITDDDVRTRINDVREKMKMETALANYTVFVKDLMKGKRIEFNRETFKKLVNIIGQLYLASSKDKENEFNKRFWNKESDEVILDAVGSEIDEIADETLLEIDGEIWTVSRFRKELNIHPLLFRKKRMKKREFAEQFKFAIADLIRDKYIAQEAEKRGYDKTPVVESNVQMWQDFLLALYGRNNYLESIGKMSNFYEKHLKVIEEDLNPYIVNLQKKYQNEIEINTELFEKIQLTNIDMVVLQKNVPFPVIVPNFPLVTTHDRLDYGRKMSFEN